MLFDVHKKHIPQQFYQKVPHNKMNIIYNMGCNKKNPVHTQNKVDAETSYKRKIPNMLLHKCIHFVYIAKCPNYMINPEIISQLAI